MSIHTVENVDPAQFSMLTDYVKRDQNRLELPGEKPQYFVSIVSVMESDTDGPHKNLTVTVEILEVYEQPNGDEIRPVKRLLREIMSIIGDNVALRQVPGYTTPTLNLELLQRHLDHVFDSTRVVEGKRIRNALRKYKIVYLGDLVQLEERKFVRVHGLGKKSHPIIRAVLSELGLTLSMSGPVVDEFKDWREPSLHDEY